MPYCLAFGCNSSSDNIIAGLHFHKFPRDKIRRSQWLRYCRRADLTKVSTHSCLCSRHFSKTNYQKDPEFMARYGYPNAKAILFKNAVPDLPLIPQQTKTTTCTGARENRTVTERGAYKKRRRLEVLKQAFDQETSGTECDQSTSSGTDIQPEVISTADTIQPSSRGSSTTKNHFEVKVSLAVPKAKVNLRTRRIQTLPVRRMVKSIQVRPPTRTIAVQCNLYEDPATVSNEEVRNEILDNETGKADPDYIPEDPEEEDGITVMNTTSGLQEKPHPVDERYFLVSESALYSLLKKNCGCENVSMNIRKFVGTMIEVELECLCGSQWWSSQGLHGKMPLGNLMLASAIMLSGSCPAKVIRLFDCLKVPIFTRQTYNNLQSCYVVPTIQDMWHKYQDILLDHLGGRDIIVGGDARCDSPGYSAKYGSYTIMNLDERIILDLQLVQSNEVKSSSHMELAGLTRAIQLLEGLGCNITELVTDRHLQVQKFMREEQPHIKHLYDVWHVAKGVQKKLEAASKKKDCAIIRAWIKSISNHIYWVAAGGGEVEIMLEKWLSVTNHISNIHTGHGKIYTDCPHGPLDQERDWIKKGSRAYKAIMDVVESKHLLRAIPKLSPVYQTYCLEVFHNVVNHFAPKSTHYFYPAMKARMYMAAFHYNENSQNGQAVNKAGEAKWRVSYPRAKKGTHSVAKPVSNGPTHGYVEFLLGAIMERRTEFPSYQQARLDFEKLTAADPSFLTDGFIKSNKQDLVDTLISRYKLNDI